MSVSECVCVYIHTYIRVYVHACMHACIHTNHTHIYTYVLCTYLFPAQVWEVRWVLWLQEGEDEDEEEKEEEEEEKEEEEEQETQMSSSLCRYSCEPCVGFRI